MMLEAFNVYLDDGEDCYKVLVPAENAKEAAKYCDGNGKVVAVIKEDEEGVNGIYVGRLAEDLSKLGWGQKEIDLITRTLSVVGLAKY